MHAAKRPSILILQKHYEPAFRFGGSTRSVVNLVAALKEKFAFKIVCLNRDFGETGPLEGVEESLWMNRNGVQVCYVDASLSRPLKLIRAIRSADYDLVYLNSFFEPLFSTLPALLMKTRLLKCRPIIMAPRGEFSPDALALSWLKKSLFLQFQSVVRLYAHACWQATAAHEAIDIKKAIGNKTCVRMARNLSARDFPIYEKRTAKSMGRLKIVFLSRVSPIKNLLTLIHSTGRLRGEINLDIWGPLDNREYWRQCQAAMALLPDDVVARYRGEARPELVPRLLGEADVFALPTLGENHGHVIHEALSSGCPVVISDRTPWRNLARSGVGFDVALEDSDSFVRSLQIFVDMEATEYQEYAARCRAYVVHRLTCNTDINASRQMFMHMLFRSSEHGTSKAAAMNDEG